MDPYVSIAARSTSQAIHRAHRGSVPAVLSLAFNPIVHLLLDLANTTPEEVLDEVLADLPQQPETTVVLLDDERLLRALVQQAPGLVLDFRPHSRPEGLAGVEWYVPFGGPIGPAYAGMVERVLRLVPRAYLLGRPQELAFLAGGERQLAVADAGEVLLLKWR